MLETSFHPQNHGAGGELRQGGCAMLSLRGATRRVPQAQRAEVTTCAGLSLNPKISTGSTSDSSLIHDGFMVTGHKAVQFETFEIGCGLQVSWSRDVDESVRIVEVKMHLERIAEDTHGLLALDGHIPSSGERDARIMI